MKLKETLDTRSAHFTGEQTPGPRRETDLSQCWGPGETERQKGRRPPRPGWRELPQLGLEGLAVRNATPTPKPTEGSLSGTFYVHACQQMWYISSPLPLAKEIRTVAADPRLTLSQLFLLPPPTKVLTLLL